MKNTTLTLRVIFTLAAFTLLTGARGCSFDAGSYEYTGYPTTPHDGGGTVYVGPPQSSTWFGDVSLSVFAPHGPSDSVTVTVREGSAFGAVVVAYSDVPLSHNGSAVLDMFDVAYGYYDVEVLGLDVYGNVVSHSATGLTVERSMTYLSLELEPTTIAGDVMMEVYEPDGGVYAGPIDTLDYSLWEYDSYTGEYIIVEQMSNIPFNPWDAPVIGNLEMGDYYVEVFAYDAFGYLIYDFNAEFGHSAAVTVLPVAFQYAY
jgi:hypothetical protein